MKTLKRFLAGEEGATVVEYALLLATLVLVSVTTMGGFGIGLGNIYTIINGSL